MWRYAAAQVCGASHLKSGSPCQDRHIVATDGPGIIVAVADGAGSASLSDVGAEVAVTTAVNMLRPHLGDPDAPWQHLVMEAARAARSAVHAKAISAERSPREYASTLLLAVIDGDRGGAMQIGDGVIAYRDQDAWGWLFWPQKGEYANTTRFLIEEDAEQAFESVSFREPFRDLAVMTDGLENLALHFATKSVHEPFLEAVIGPLRGAGPAGEVQRVSAALDGLLQSDRISSKTDDDLTLVLATRALP